MISQGRGPVKKLETVKIHIRARQKSKICRL